MQDIVTRFFVRGGKTADIGCGSGREVAWLNAKGFPAEGFDASDGLLSEARSRYPQLTFIRAELPGLQNIAAGTYDNVLCETVIMHLDRVLIAPSVRRVLDIVKPGGIFYLSWRVTEGIDLRDSHGRLYAAFLGFGQFSANLSPLYYSSGRSPAPTSRARTINKV